MEIVTVTTPSLGDRSYLVTDGDAAAVIDPQRDIDRIEALLVDRSLRLTDVLETHVHNDYVSGGLGLARRHGARYHVAADEEVAYDRTPVRDGDEIKVGTLVLRAVHTPGHTPTHLSYVLTEDGGDDVAVFTGGSMLYGSVGRTDLITPAATEDLTRRQYRSVRSLADLLSDDVAVNPTHGFGSFCSSGSTVERDTSTIGQEREDNQALTTDDEDEFTETLMAGLDDFPAYYAHMAPLNRAGSAAPVDLTTVESVDTAELLLRIERGDWVVDLRPRDAFSREHLAGSVNIELEDQTAVQLAWMTAPWASADRPPRVTLLADTHDDVATMQRQLVRIGIDRPAGAFVGGMAALADHAPRASIETTDFAGVAAARDHGRDLTVLDVRQPGEWRDGHVADAVHVPIYELPDRLDELPDTAVAVHCASGFRASIATSLLTRAGFTAVLIDDTFDDHAPEHLEIV